MLAFPNWHSCKLSESFILTLNFFYLLLHKTIGSYGMSDPEAVCWSHTVLLWLHRAEMLNTSQGTFPYCTVRRPAHHRLQEDLGSHPATDAFGSELFIATALDWVCGDHKTMTANGALCPYISSYT